MAEPPPQAADPELAPDRKKWRRIAVLALEITVVCVLGWALYRRRESLLQILDLDVADILILFILTALAAPFRAAELVIVTRALGAPLGFSRSLALAQGANLLNYVPMQAGNLLRARVLKTQQALPYSKYVALMTSLVALAVSAAAVVGLIALAFSTGLSREVSVVATSVFVALLALTTGFFVVPFSFAPGGGSWIAHRIGTLMVGLGQIKANRRALLALFGLGAATPILLGMRYWICFGAMSRDTGPAESILFAAAVLASAPVNITPAGLGTRELIGSAIGAAAGFGFAEVLAAVAIDRGVSVIYALLVGGGSLLWMRRERMI